jgi:hypothetical protein
MKMFKIVVVLLLSLIFMVTLNIEKVHAFGYWEENIDVLIVEDDEFAALPWWNKNWFYSGFYDALDYYVYYYGFPIYIRGTIKWESPDGWTDAVSLLQKAISDLGYEHQNYYYGYYCIDLLVVLTAQNMNVDGLSPAPWYAMIIKWVWSGVEIVTAHEFGHQFGLVHCSNTFCVMNVNPISLYLCGSCFEKAQANYPERFLRWVEVEVPTQPTQCIPRPRYYGGSRWLLKM